MKCYRNWKIIIATPSAAARYVNNHKSIAKSPTKSLALFMTINGAAQWKAVFHSYFYVPLNGCQWIVGL